MGLFSSNKNSYTSTLTEHKYYDQRQVNDASGGGVIGTGNYTDQSLSLVNVSTDGGAFDLVGRIADGVADTSRLQVLAAERIATSGAGASNAAFEFAEQAQRDAASFNERAASRTFDLATSSNAQAYGFSSDALGLARSVVEQAGDQARQAAATASGAYQSAADTATGNKTLIYAGMAAVAVVALAFAFQRG